MRGGDAMTPAQLRDSRARWMAWAENRERAAENLRRRANAAEAEVAALRSALRQLTSSARDTVQPLLEESYRRTRAAKARARKREVRRG